MRVLITAGGTGGHIHPALAIASYLKEHQLANHILWIKGKKKLESELLSSQEFEIRQIITQAFPRAFSSKWIEFIVKLLISFFQSFLILLRFRPKIVIGMGSFHSYPVVMVAFFLGIRTLICEQNVRLSLTNKLLSPYVLKIATSFPQTNRYLSPRIKNKTQFVGNPVRPEILTATRKEGIKKLNLDKDKFTILFLGGSQGAHNLNKVAIESIKLLDKEKIRNNVQIIFITGKNDIEWVKKSLESLRIKSLAFSYLKEIQYAYAASHLVICRSGATTIAEITARGLPAILIPYPYATREHQHENGKVLQAKGAAYLFMEKDLTPERLKNLTLSLTKDKILLKKMSRQSKKLGRPQATQEVVKLICNLTNQVN